METAKVYKMTKNFWESAGLTEDEYWNEYAINSYKQLMAIEELQRAVTKNISDNEKYSYWQEFVEKTILDFEKKNSISIKEFHKQAQESIY
ncbi:MAG TPA: hypothetical protein GX525_10135 [Bacilli bacterium]|nr:hypothetical protein [Bacilli bacterium]